MPSSTAWSTTPTVSSCAATACAESGPRRLPRLDPDHPPDGDNHPPADERHPGRHQSERPADMILEPVADIAPEQAADIIGIRTRGAFRHESSPKGPENRSELWRTHLTVRKDDGTFDDEDDDQRIVRAPWTRDNELPPPGFDQP